MNQFSLSLPLISDHCLVEIILSLIGMLTVIGAWLDESLHSGWI